MGYLAVRPHSARFPGVAKAVVRATFVAVAGLLAAPVVAQAVPLYRTGALPFSQPDVALADTGETVVAFKRYLGAYHWGLQVSLGTPGRGFGAPQSLGEDVTLRGVDIDAAGNAVVAWDKPVGRANCNKFGCDPADVQLFVSVRRPGAPFGAPQLVAHETNVSTPPPLLAMSRGGRYAVVFACQYEVWCVLAGEPGALPGPPQRIDERLAVASAAIDDAGNVTLGGEYRLRASTVVWHPNGTTDPVETLDQIQDPSFTSVRDLSVSAGGEAIAGWAHVGQNASSAGAYLAVRPAGGRFGSPVLLRAGSSGLSLVGIDAQGRGIAAWLVSTNSHPLLLAAAQATAGGPFGESPAISSRDRIFESTPSLAVGPDGSAVVVWLDSPGDLQAQHARAAFRRAGGSFAGPVGLSDGDQEAPDPPQAAVASQGRAVIVWTSVANDEQRILAQGFGAGGATAPTVVARGPAPQVAPGLMLGATTDVGVGQRVHMRSDGRIYPRLICVAPPGSTCRGTVRVRTVRIKGRQRRYTVASGTFRLRRGARKRIGLRVFRTARRALRKRMLDCVITTSTNNAAGAPWRDSEELFIARTPRRRR